MITLAFYRGRGSSPWHRVQETAIRAATRGVYSHVELVPGRANLDGSNVCLSASGRDGGVREKVIFLDRASWDLVEVPVPAVAASAFIRDRIGARYDYAGVLMSQVVAIGRHDDTKWFCSEICAGAIGLPNPQRVSPQLLFDIVNWRGSL